MTGGMPVSMPAPEEDEFELNAEVVMSHITDKPHMMVVNSLSNPVGAVLVYNDLTSLAKLAVERDLIVISDEVWKESLMAELRS
jgi:aspartate/methionine/tyrosine aminotransferase